jgi:hypothetical protein
VGNQPIIFCEVIIATTVYEMIKVLFENFIHLAVEDPIFLEYETGRITKGGSKRLYGLLFVQANQELFLGDLEKKDFTYHQAFLKNRPIFLKKNAIPSAAATIACTR